MIAFKDKKLVFLEDRIVMEGHTSVDSTVMFEYEHPLMKKHADMVTQFGGDILEIGFGMGISADYIQSNDIKSHTIVELHPQILPKLYEWSKDKSNVRIIEGDWFERIEEICSMEYDGIFFDTHMDPHAYDFRRLVVDRCLRDGGVFTWFDLLGKSTYGYDNVIIDDVFMGEKYGICKCPYIFSNHQLK